MVLVAGRSSEPRAVSVTTSLASTALTAPAGTFHEEDAGRTITGTGIPAGATIASVTSATAATLSAAATAGGTVTATIGAGAHTTYGFVGWSPESDEESEAYSVAANNAGVVPPDRITDPNTGTTQRGRA